MYLYFMIRTMKNSLAFILIMIFTVSSLDAQFENIIYDDHTYVDYIKTVEAKVNNLDSSFPFLKLNGGVPLRISFDDIEGREADYYYHIIHMDRDWQPTDIDEEDYLRGFNGEDIPDYRLSGQTTISYVHYSFNIPNENQRLLISGNYLLVIVDEDDQPIITRRFVVFEPKVGIDKSVERSFKADEVRTHQRVHLKDFVKPEGSNNLQENIEIRVIQNGNWDIAYHNIVPINETEEFLHFSPHLDLSFQGLTEFRSFDTRSLDYTTLNVFSIDIHPDRIDVLLDKNLPRANISHVAINDNNGQFYITKHLQTNFDRAYNRSVVESEYTNVIFNLKVDFPYDEDLYVLGAFNNFKKVDEYKMRYDSELGMYLCTGVLKQGYYDYFFGLDKGDYIDYREVEGSHSETENYYTILIYYKDPVKYHDEVIGLVSFTSKL